jgi:transposase
VRLLQTENTGKSDPNDALSVAVAALRSRAQRPVLADDRATALKVWAKRHRDLSRARNQAACRLHAVLCDLVPGGFGTEITAGHAARILGRITPAGPAGQARSDLAAELLADLRHLDAQRREVNKRLATEVKAAGTSVTGIFGVGPVIAATVIGDVVTVARFPSRDHFAAYNGTAPVEVSSGPKKIYRLSLRGNRRLNHAIHMAAITQIRHKHSDGRRYYQRKIAEGKTHKEARAASSGGSATPSTPGCAPTPARAVREGNRGTSLSPGRPALTPNAGSSGKPLPDLKPAYEPEALTSAMRLPGTSDHGPDSHLTTTKTKRIRSGAAALRFDREPDGSRFGRSVPYAVVREGQRRCPGRRALPGFP